MPPETFRTINGAEVTADGTVVNPSPDAVGSDPFIDQLQRTLLSRSDLISSSNDEIDTKIDEAISGVQTAGEKSKERIESQFGRERLDQAAAGARRITTAREAQRGFATNTALLKTISEETEKSLRDLDQRKEELILQGDAESAATIANLQLKGLEFKQNAQQQVFNNLLGLANFSLTRSAESRADRAQNFAERQQIGQIALDFGIEVREDDTLDTIIARAQPFADEARSLELARLRADIRRANAEAAKAEAGASFQLDDVTARGLASTLNSLATSADPFAAASIQAILGNVVEQHGAEGLEMVKRFQLEDSEARFSEDNLRSDYTADIQNGLSRGDILKDIENNIVMSEEQKEKAKKVLDEVAPKPRLGQTTGSPLGDLAFGFFQLTEDVGASFTEFVTGSRPKGFSSK